MNRKCHDYVLCWFSRALPHAVHLHLQLVPVHSPTRPSAHLFPIGSMALPGPQSECVKVAPQHYLSGPWGYLSKPSDLSISSFGLSLFYHLTLLYVSRFSQQESLTPQRLAPWQTTSNIVLLNFFNISV